ncbi:MAG: excisionase family DNA-binding protein [Fimbriimonadaceae bacterium]|nr:excisionase family DNA-binding protein [Fimbriimonadaceae bacterium]
MYSTAEVAEQIGVSKNTLLRWIAEGRLPDVSRDWRNWRVWDERDVVRAAGVRDALHGRPSVAAPESLKRGAVREYAAELDRLGEGRRQRPPSQRPAVDDSKAAAYRQYAAELTELGQGRSYRAK